MSSSSSSMHIKPFVFCPPPPGKPAPTEPSDSGKRVAQSPQKGPTCYYYALNFIRERVGKQPTRSQLGARKVEVMISTYRKTLTTHFEKSGWIESFAQHFDKFDPFTKQDAQRYLEVADRYLVEKYRKRCCDLLISFCRQDKYKDLKSYIATTMVEIQRQTLQIHRGFLTKNGITNEMIEKFYGQDLGTMSLQRRVPIYAGVTNITMYRAYKLQQSAWHPSHPIDSLVHTLSLHGPHVVVIIMEPESPLKLPEKIEGRPIYKYLYSHNQRVKLGDSSHAVVLVGANSENGDVYFIDPSDGSDPKIIETQKIYLMAYAYLKSAIMTIDGRCIRTKDGYVSDDFISPPRSRTNDYALHRKSKEIIAKL